MLTKRQSEVVMLMSEGYENAEIAAALGISEETVKTHVRKTLARLGARNRAHAVGITMKGESERGAQE